MLPFDAMTANPRIDGYQLTLRQLGVLAMVYGNPRKSYSVKDLAEPLHLPKPCVTRALDALEHEELIKRGSHDTDKRQIKVLLTRDGTALMTEIGKVMGNGR